MRRVQVKDEVLFTADVKISTLMFNIPRSGQGATSLFIATAHGLRSFLIWLSLESVMMHKMIGSLIFNPNSRLIGGSFSLPFF